MIERITISNSDFNELSDYIYSLTGIYIDINRKESVEIKLTTRMKINQITDFKEYFNILKNEPTQIELREFIDLITVNETYFFRNSPQLNTFQTKVVPLILENNKNAHSLKIWSAGCSIGCEPYTIAIILRETIPDIKDWDIYILGSDISQSSLKVAKAGLYTQREIKEVSAHLLTKYFTKVEKYYKISNDIIQMVNFREFNMLDFSTIDSLPNFDVIFCRNILIYFDDASRKKVVDKLYEKLNIPGYIFLGHSESLNRISKAFVLKRIGSDLVYVKE